MDSGYSLNEWGRGGHWAATKFGEALGAILDGRGGGQGICGVRSSPGRPLEVGILADRTGALVNLLSAGADDARLSNQSLTRARIDN